MKRILYLIIPLLILILSCDDKKNENAVDFSYRAIIDKEYRSDVGRVIPITISQAVETDGDISRDGNYFFYSSNSDAGNFDIYLRSMTDITTVRLTSHPAKDIMPVISPDGKRLAFVSFRDNPEGDIFMLKIDPAKLIDGARKSVSSLSSLDNKIKNITIEKDKDSGVVINTKNSSPAWSPDSKYIAYSSTKDGIANIWIMESNGSNKRRLTQESGEYPSFSPDGSTIVFVSYRDNVNGDLYTIDVASGAENKIISDKSIKFNPAFMENTSKLIYSSIEKDTNGNSILDIQDKSIIRFIDLNSGLTYPLTKRSESSLKAKWLPVLNTREYNGVIIYNDIIGENISLNIIPETGIIPKRGNAKLQYELCDSFMTDYDDVDKYLLALEFVYNIYGRNNDNASKVYVNRALEEAALYYINNKNRGEAERITSIIKKRSDEKDNYASFILSIIDKPFNVKGTDDLVSIVKKFELEKNNGYYTPFAIEDIGDTYFKKKDYNSALKMYNYIVSNHGNFERILDIHTKISLCSDDLRKSQLSDSAVQVFTNGNENQRILIIKNLIVPFVNAAIRSSDVDIYIKNITAYKDSFKDNKKILAVLCHVAGLLYDIKGSTDNSRDELIQSITLSHPNDFASYLSNIKFGDIERKQSRFVEAEKYFNAGISRYLRRFKTENFKEKFLWLITYYEQVGEKNELSGNFKDASDTYKKLINIIAPIFNQRLYPEVYSEFAPRTHIKYIDTYTSWKGESSIIELEDNYRKDLSVYRMGFNRAAIYGFAYIYTKKALYLKSLVNGMDSRLEDVYQAFKMADINIDWALFMNDAFIEAYILKSWIYQYIDEDRNSDREKTEQYANKYFERYLWEQNIVILEKALTMNDENVNPDNEGDLHLNMGNNYFLLLNYPNALKSYKLAEKYKRNFGSDIEKAIFYFHVGYTLWQNDEINKAHSEINKAHDIYNSLSQISGFVKYKEQYLILYRYFALFSRYDNKFPEAINWYKKIIDFAGKNRLNIDRARYYQEIANCYMNMKDYDSARAYLDQADMLLQKYPDDERKYYFKLRMFKYGQFSLGPFSIYNAGPDMAVIGNNKIFYPLDTQSKKLLNLSMFEEIAVSEGDYNEAIKNLAKKVALLEKSSTAVSIDARIRSLNNLGYYSQLSGKTGDAEKYFNQAANLSKKNDNLEGTFASMMNIVNLYALAAEEGLNTDKEWENKSKTLIGKIDEYKKSYYKLRLDQEKEILNQKAKAKNEKVTSQQIAETAALVEQEAQSKYYLLDISSATLKFYLAEYIYASDPSLDGKTLKKDKDLYSLNRDAYNLYSEALNSFESGNIEAEKYRKNELKVKLLLNKAVCYERVGEIEKAYVAFLDAKDLCEKSYLNLIKINVYHRLANFINIHGAEVERGNYPNLADTYFTSSISAIEEYPVLYSSHSNRVRIIYNDYINFLINRGEGEKGFKVSERYAQTSRIISINLLSPRFGNEYDRKKYYEFSSELGKLNTLRDNLSSLLLTGADPLSKDVVTAKTNMSVQEKKIKTLINDIMVNNSSIKNYIALPAYKIPTVNNNIFKFHKTEKGNYYWKISKGVISYGYLKDDPASVLSSNSGAPIIILLNNTVVDMINSGKLASSEKYIFINALDRAPDYLTDLNNISGNIYSDERGVRRALAGIVNVNDEKKGARGTLGDSSLIVDKEGVGDDITPGLLFSSSISPACIIKSGINIDYQYLTSFMEGALYAGTKRLIVTSGKDSVLPILKALYGKSDNTYNSPFFTLGYIDTFNSEKNNITGNIKESERNLFNEYMIKCDFEKALVHLSRLYPLEKDRDSSEYVKNLWLIKLLSGDLQGSLAVINSYSPKDDGEKSAMMLRKVYTHIYFGDMKNADMEMNKLAESDNLQEEIKIINSIINLIKEGDLSAIDVLAKIKKPYNTAIPMERYFIIAAKFLFMTGNGSAAKIASLIPEKSCLSEDEYIMRYLMCGIKPPLGKSIRFDKIIDLWSMSDLTSIREEALKLIRGESGEDSLSPFPVIETILKHKNKDMNRELIQFIEWANLSNIISKSDNLTSLILLRTVDDLFSAEENYKDRVSILDNILKISSANQYNSIRNETYYNFSMNYFLTEDFQESYNRAIDGEKFILPNDKNYADIELLLMMLYIQGGKYKDAEIKGDTIAKIEGLSLDRKYMLNLQQSLIELNRLRSLKSANISDAAQFEKLFSTTVALARHDTELLNRKGYRKITELIFDEFINYKMRTSQHTDAHYYNEMKKVLTGSSKCGINLFKYSSAIDMNAIQGIIPDNGIYVNIAKNKDNIFVWAADKKSKSAFIIENGYSLFSKRTDEYNLNLDSGKDITVISKEFTNILSQVYKLMKDKNVIFISPDSDSEKIPFEILGEGDYLSNRASIIYIPSLLVTMADSNLFTAEVYLPESDNSASASLSRVAINESGIKYNTKSHSKTGIIHLYSKFTYNQNKRNFTFNNRDIKSFANNCGLLVASSGGIEGAGVTDFLVFGRDLNIKAALLNGSRVQDVNSAVFTEEFYRNFGKGIAIQESFTLALNKVKNSKYSHPMNWSGYRLYVYDLNIIRKQ
ncbi:MAG: hypothetical protein FWF73_03015 [Spirochaetes bacterium]|nr:hypothetical protein [Spirochaetota bacterium]